MATIGRCYYWSHTSARSVRLYTGECVVNSSTGLWDRAPLKDKTATQIVNAFNEILRGGRIPKKLRTDAAKDFTSDKFQKLMKDRNIVHFVTHNEKQANYVERFIKTLKSRIS